jgi:hypothetical protein
MDFCCLKVIESCKSLVMLRLLASNEESMLEKEFFEKLTKEKKQLTIVKNYHF